MNEAMGVGEPLRLLTVDEDRAGLEGGRAFLCPGRRVGAGVVREPGEGGRAMNVVEQRRILEGIARLLSSASGLLESAVGDAHRLRDEADEDCPFDEDTLDEDLCGVIENLCDDVREAIGEVDGLLEWYDGEEEEA